jgi:6-pyruvoyltetrahydropterin/6-carboxytetrahydropterin synthase
MSSDFHVRVTKDYLVFSAAHFITFNGNVCERLHGHNYRVAAEVAGPLDENHYVVDFIAVRDALQKIVAELDHYMLLPMQHPQIRVRAEEKSVEVTFEDRRWVFPRGDCVLLPVPNTTAEKLAEYIGRRLLDDLQARLGSRPNEIRVEVDECNGQIGVCRLSGE